MRKVNKVTHVGTEEFHGPDQHLSEPLLGHSSFCGMLSMEEEFQHLLELGFAYPHYKLQEQHWPKNIVENIIRKNDMYTCMRKKTVK